MYNRYKFVPYVYLELSKYKNTMATKVKLRQKKISKGRKSLYLDFYPPIPHQETGEPTRREFLGMYLFEKPKTPTDKQHNSETLQIGNSIRPHSYPMTSPWSAILHLKGYAIHLGKYPQSLLQASCIELRTSRS